MDRWRNKVVLVTGASSGIGSDLTRTLLQAGVIVAGCARRADRISEQVEEELRGNLHSYKCDLSNPEEVEGLFEQVRDELGPVDACVVNAGLTAGGKMAEASIGEWKQMLDVNVVAASQCAKLALQHMQEKQKQEGALIFVNSMSGHAVHPHPSTRFYSATKFATTALIEGWRAEVRKEDKFKSFKVLHVSLIN